jgi:diguanylate cyclase (GGDEF)-like protein
MNRIASLEQKSHLFWVGTGILFVVGIGAVDFITGRELAFSLFYLIPIVLTTWFAGRSYGLLVSVLSAITWLVADIFAGQPYSQPIIPYWNTLIRLGFFVVVTLLLPALKELGLEKELARIDYLTGIANRRSFFEFAQRELELAQRYEHPLTIVYIDLDDFKSVNDQGGHRVGDRLLCAVADQAAKHSRKTDLLARLGGDEFILLLPETGQAGSKLIVSRIQLALLGEMQRNNWPVTFSIGVLTWQHVETTMDELIKKADELMYSVKKNGKNGIAYAVFAT